MAKTSINTATPPATGNKFRWWLFIPLLLIVAGASAAGVYFYMAPKGTQAVAAEQAPAKPATPPVFVDTKPFTVNLQDDSGRMLYVGVAMKVPDDAASAQLNAHMPEVRNRILMVLTTQKAEQLTTTQGKQALADDILASLSKPFDDGQQKLAVNEVLFTDFIVQ